MSGDWGNPGMPTATARALVSTQVWLPPSGIAYKCTKEEKQTSTPHGLLLEFGDTSHLRCAGVQVIPHFACPHLAGT